MARSKSGRSKGKRRASASRSSRRSAGSGARAPSRDASTNAIELLKADHRQVEEWFGEFEGARSDRRKLELAGKICKALTVHAQIEEEIFYPASSKRRRRRICTTRLQWNTKAPSV
jgi:hypothetical protein